MVVPLGKRGRLGGLGPEARVQESRGGPRVVVVEPHVVKVAGRWWAGVRYDPDRREGVGRGWYLKQLLWLIIYIQ